MTTDISVGVRWDPVTQQEIEDYDYDGGNSSSRLFERSRIKALAGNKKKSFARSVPLNCADVLLPFIYYSHYTNDFAWFQTNANLFRKRHFANGSIHTWFVPIVASRIFTPIYEMERCLSNYLKYYPVNGYPKWRKGKWGYTVLKMWIKLYSFFYESSVCILKTWVRMISSMEIQG